MRFRVAEELESERLLLRQFNGDDWRAMHAYYSDISATRFTLGRELTEGETWRTVASMVGHWQLHGYGPYAAEDKQTQILVGVVGFWYPADWPEPEIKWGLIPTFWGQGFASEGARTVLREAHRSIPDTSLISFIDRRNTASIHVANAVGATFEKEVTFRNAQFQIYRHREHP